MNKHPLSNNLRTVGKENLTPSHMNILSPNVPSSRTTTTATGQTFSKSSSSSALSSNKPTIGSYSRSKSYIYVPSLEELKQNQLAFNTLAELFSKLDTFPTLYSEQKIQFIRLCIQCIGESFLKVHEKDIYMFWMLLAITFVGFKDGFDEEAKEILYEHFEFLSSYNHPVKDEENFYILNALFEWKINVEPDRTFKSLAKIQQGIKRVGETPILAEIKTSILKKSIFPQAEISYRPTTTLLSQQTLQAPTSNMPTTKSSPQEMGTTGTGLFTGNRRRRSNSNSDFQIQQNSTRQTSRSNLFSTNKQSSITISTETSSVSSNPFTSNNSATPIATPTIVSSTLILPGTPQQPPTPSFPVHPTPTYPTPTSTITENVHKRKREEVVSTPVQLLTTEPTSNAPNSAQTTPSEEDSAKKQKTGTVIIVPINNRNYKVSKKIGTGGSGAVYKCTETKTNQEVAVKHIKVERYNNDKSVIEGFLAEATLLEQLRADDVNQNIITLLDYEYRPHSKRDELLLVMELGTADFNHIIKKKNKSKPFTPDELRVYWRQMLEAVAFIHSKKIVHTDIKPANFLLVNGKLKLIDFGIAKVPDHDNTQSISRTSIVGTLNFMPPESFTNHSNNDPKYKFGPPGDIWSLGIIFYQTIYHKTPFSDYEDHLSKITQITDKNKPPHFPPCDEQYHDAIDLLKIILVKDPQKRASVQTILNHRFFTQADNLELSLHTNEEQEAFCRHVLKTFEHLLSQLPSQSIPPQKAAFELLKLCHNNRNGDNMSEDDIVNCLK